MAVAEYAFNTEGKQVSRQEEKYWLRSNDNDLEGKTKWSWGDEKARGPRERWGQEVSVLFSCFLLLYSDCTSLFSFQKISFFLFYGYVWVPAYLCACHLCVSCLQRPEWGGVTGSCALLAVESWELNLGLCKSNKGPPLQSPLFFSGPRYLNSVLSFSLKLVKTDFLC